ncbi:hypothetical protein ACEPAI_7023 [Sanghuangporus weigelae]
MLVTRVFSSSTTISLKLTAMSRDDVDADYAAVENDEVDDDEVDVDYPYPWDDEPDEPDRLQPKTRPNLNDPTEPRNRRDRDRFRSRVGDDGSLTLPGQIKGLTLPGQIEGSSQETQDGYPAGESQQELPPGQLHSDDLSGYPRLSLSDLLNGTEAMTPRHNRRAPIAKETPLAFRMTKNKRAIQLRKAEHKHLRNANDGIKVLIGPMPVEEFLNEFLPAVDESDMPDPTGAFNAVPVKAVKEREIYSPLIAAINEYGRCPGLTFVDTAVTSEQHGRGVSKPDVTAYNEGDVSLLKRVRSKRTNVIHTCANLGIAESFMEVKPDGHDPLKDDHGEDENFFAWENYKEGSSDWEKKKKAFGQQVSYASEGCARQHRVFYHSVIIVGTKARFFRWDRAGTIVTRAFDYRRNPRLFCQYLWRFSGANMIERGFDPTVTVASEHETKLFEKAVTDEVAFQKGIDKKDQAKLDEALRVHYEGKKVTKASIYNSSQSKTEEYLVSVPVHSPFTSAGRCCRGYWSTKLVRKSDGSTEGGPVGFLKDVWRIALPRLTPEGNILTNMTGTVPNVPEPDCFGDVMNDSHNESEVLADGGGPVIGTSGKVQTTKTQNFIYKEWVSDSCKVLPEHSTDDLYRRVVRHVHYRLALKTVGYPLSDFTDAVELFLTLQDVLEALIVAYEKCKRLHRDVSLDNIILCRCRVTGRRVGVLIDWEFSVLVDREGKAGDYYRSGTWAYMSTNVLLRPPGFRHSHQDDLESLLYVSLHCAVLWLPHNVKRRLGTWVYHFFDYSLDNETIAGGGQKGIYKRNPSKFSTEFVFTNGHITAWFSNAYADLATYAEEHVKGHTAKTTWTSKTVRHHMRVVCDAISKGKQQGLERVVHNVEDKFEGEEAYYWVTYISASNIATDSRISEISQHQSGRGSKRSLTEFEEGFDEPQPENKRSRLSIRSTNSDHLSLRLDSDAGSDNDVGGQQEQDQESQDQESPDELLLQPLARKDRHDPRRSVNEDFSNKPDVPIDDDDDDDNDGDLYV